MAKFFDSGNDTGTLIRKLGQAAFGAATAKGEGGGSASFGDRLSGGVQAASSGSIPEFVEERDASNLSSAQTNKAMVEAQALRAEQKALETPFDLASLVGGADSTGTLFPAIQEIFDKNQVDMDGNGITTQKEVLEAIDDGRLDLQEVSDVIGNSLKKLNKSATVNTAEVDEALKKFNASKGWVGEKAVTRQTFAESETFAKGNQKLAGLIQEEQIAAQKIKELQGAQANVAQDARERTRGKSQQEIKNRALAKPEVRAALTEADQLIQTIIANGGSWTVPGTGEEITEQKVIDKLERMFPEIVQEIRGRLGQANRQAFFTAPSIDAQAILAPK